MYSFCEETSDKEKLGRPRRRWEYIKLDIKEIGLGGMLRGLD